MIWYGPKAKSYASAMFRGDPEKKSEINYPAAAFIIYNPLPAVQIFSLSLQVAFLSKRYHNI